MDVSIVIVNWNSADFTIACVESIQSHTLGLGYEIIVVDNASDGDSWTAVAEHISSGRLIRADKNLGFAGANNLGATYAHGRHLLFLNPDTLAANDAIVAMSRILDDNPRIGILGGRLLNRDLTLQKTCVQPFPTITNQILTVDWLKRRWPRLPLWGMRPLFCDDPSGFCEAEVVCGACLMVRRDIFENIGGFGPEYFMYAEEMDLCYRVRQAGWKVCHATKAQIVHFGGQCTKRRGDEFTHVVMRESVFTLLQKFRGEHYAFLYRLAMLVSALLRLSVLIPLSMTPARLIDREAVKWARNKWTAIASWCLAFERWTRELRPINVAVVKN